MPVYGSVLKNIVSRGNTRTNLEGNLEVVVALSWCCAGASRCVWVAEHAVEGEVLESGEGKSEEVA
jgi:hypothetical protein